MSIDESAFDGRVVDECDVAISVLGKSFQNATHDRAAEGIVEIDDQVAARKRIAQRVCADDANVTTAQSGAIDRREIVARDRAQRGRYFDADDLAERMACGQQQRAAHPRAEIDERRALARERNVRDERVEVADGRGLVVRRMLDAGPDRLRVEFAQEQERFGCDAAFRIEALARAPAPHVHLGSHAGWVRRRQRSDMPEGPQVARYARLQAEKLAGRIVNIDSPNGRSDDVAALFDGATLRSIEAIGKHLIYDFGNERLLHIHLGRFGNFHSGAMPLPEERGVLRLRLSTDEDWYELRGAIAIEPFDATRRASLEGRIGPNPLDPHADIDGAYDKIVKSRSAVGLLLMDQSIVGGIGSIYRSEVLFLNRIHPRAPGTSLEREVWHAMWADLARVMADGAKVGRIVTTHAADRAKPRGAAHADDRFYVYHRTGRPCRHCGTPVEEIVMGNRRVFFCPLDQPAPHAAAAEKPAVPKIASRKKGTPGKSAVKKVSSKKSSR